MAAPTPSYECMELCRAVFPYRPSICGEPLEACRTCLRVTSDEPTLFDEYAQLCAAQERGEWDLEARRWEWRPGPDAIEIPMTSAGAPPWLLPGWYSVWVDDSSTSTPAYTSSRGSSRRSSRPATTWSPTTQEPSATTYSPSAYPPSAHPALASEEAWSAEPSEDPSTYAPSPEPMTWDEPSSTPLPTTAPRSASVQATSTQRVASTVTQQSVNASETSGYHQGNAAYVTGVGAVSRGKSVRVGKWTGVVLWLGAGLAVVAI